MCVFKHRDRTEASRWTKASELTVLDNMTLYLFSIYNNVRQKNPRTTGMMVLSTLAGNFGLWIDITSRTVSQLRLSVTECHFFSSLNV